MLYAEESTPLLLLLTILHLSCQLPAAVQFTINNQINTNTAHYELSCTSSRSWLLDITSFFFFFFTKKQKIQDIYPVLSNICLFFIHI
jgi:hypothetical protein